MALFKRSRKAPEPPPLAADAITIYLANDDRAFDPDPGVHVTVEGFSPYLDEALTIPLEENQEALVADRIVYSRIVGGTHHEADLNNAVFDLGSKLGLVALVRDASNSHDANAVKVCGVTDKAIYTAGYLPRTLAAVVATLVGPGGAANAAVIETVSRGGTRVGLKIIASVGRDMVVKSVSQ
jgi:HIRAN domain